VRIYPTVVFRGTELCQMAEAGVYSILDEADAIERTKIALRVFVKHGVPCIRIGLCASEKLASGEVFGGANHSAIGELAMSRIYYREMCRAIENCGDVRGKSVTFLVARGAISLAVGQKRENIQRIYKKYLPLRVKVLEKNEILRYNIMIECV
jgi:histone acetyltransferase (RNA polymerase elongator complex component)